MYYRKLIFFYVSQMICIGVVFLGWVFIADPFMFFHKNWFNDGVMHQNFRVQSYGLIKNGDFAGIILGTSMLENTSANEASEKLGGKFANLSIEAASYWEKFKILNFALQTKKINRVIMSLDMKFNKKKEINETFEPLLYSRFSLLGILKIYAKSNAVSCIFTHKFCDYRNLDLDRPNAWYILRDHAVRFGGLESWLENKYSDQLQDVFRFLLTEKSMNYELVRDYKEIIDEEILPLFEYKEVSFDLIIPPYFALWWAKNLENFDVLMKPYEYLIEKSVAYDNVKIYWFYDEDFVFDISFYKDLTHYDVKVNSWQIDAIKDKSHIINVTNYHEKISLFKKQLEAFDAEYFLNVFRENNVLSGM